MDRQKPYFLSNPEKFQEQESTYLKVRRLEGRVLGDAAVAALPDVSSDSPYAKEWRWRRRSFQRLKNYMQARKKGPARILDVGCGNGWMSNRLAEITRWQVSSLDINQEELAQAARLFGRENLQFYYADLPGLSLPALDALGQFDFIVLAASVQYFQDLAELVSYLRFFLHTDGEIHIIDSHFYRDAAAAAAAKQRTLGYYTNIGAPEMAAHYHHHLWHDARRLGAADLNAGLWAKLQQKAGYLAPFPWVRLRRN